MHERHKHGIATELVILMVDTLRHLPRRELSAVLRTLSRGERIRVMQQAARIVSARRR